MAEEMSQDKIEIKNLRKENAKLEAYLNNLVQIIPASIYWKDVDSVILGDNLLHAKIAGLKCNNDAVGKTDYDFIWKNQAARIIENDKMIMHSKQGLKLEEEATLSDGKIHTFLTSKEPMFDKNKNVIGIIGVSLDITELKETQEELIKAKETAESALQSLQQSQIENTKHKADLKIAQITIEKEQEMRKTVMMLVGDIVHDLRTPMATIDSATDILSSISPGLHELIKEAYELKSKALESINGKKLDYVVNKMSVTQKKAINFMGQFINTTLHELSVAQKHPEGDVAPEELSKCSIRRVLENTMEGYPRRKNLVINQCSSYDFIFMGNSILMLKMLFNLIKNADEQILANGKGEITISTKEAEDKNLLIIKDTAGGAPPEIVENIFKEFFTTKKDGTGIGLAFCKKMMQNFGGDLICHSVFGEYIEFTLSFPKTGETQPYNVKS